MAQQNLFGELYVRLSNYLKTAVPDIRWIDMDFGQLDLFEMRPDVDFPCTLIDFPDANFSQLGNLSQLGEFVIQVKLGFAPFSKSHQTAPNSVKEKALEYFTLEQKIYEACQGWDAEGLIQPMIRGNALTDKRAEEFGLRVRVISFTSQFEDYSAKGEYVKTAKPGLGIEQNVVLCPD